MKFWSSLATGDDNAAWKAPDPNSEFLSAEEVANAILALVDEPVSTIRRLVGSPGYKK